MLDSEIALISKYTNLAREELIRASRIHSPMCSSHEGYGVILEELDEAWDAIKANDIAHARHEMIQVAAMALRFLVDVKPGEGV